MLKRKRDKRMKSFEREIKQGERFEFGKNWQNFLSVLTEERIKIAMNSMTNMLKIKDLTGKKFLDIGSGSGLFSLVARQLGAEVQSFDYDPESVACTKELRARYMPNDQGWVVQQGSILDKYFLNSLGEFDVIYSWGVLHHTGNMWAGLENIIPLVRKNGIIFIAIYNDQGNASRFWKKIKEIYCSGFLGKAFISATFIPLFFCRTLAASAIKRQNLFAEHKKKNRGMSLIHDWFDWLGGLPFEVAKVEEIFSFFRDRKFSLINITTSNGLGNNQYVFLRNPDG